MICHAFQGGDIFDMSLTSFKSYQGESGASASK